MKTPLRDLAQTRAKGIVQDYKSIPMFDLGEEATPEDVATMKAAWQAEHHPTVYIAGPMRGLPEYNFPAFFAAERLLLAKGWSVYNPARVDIETDGFDPKTGANLQPVEVYMRRDFDAILNQCNALAVLPDWRDSSGATREHTMAEGLAYPILDATTGEPLVEAGDPIYLQTLAHMASLHRRKAAGYSGIGAMDTWSNFREAEHWGVSPLAGCMVRMGDKYRRSQNLFTNPLNDQVGEPMVETLEDLAAYALIGVSLIKEEANGNP
jgi:hypothetical protein